MVQTVALLTFNQLVPGGDVDLFAYHAGQSHFEGKLPGVGIVVEVLDVRGLGIFLHFYLFPGVIGQ
jgi:hypothetical protein